MAAISIIQKSALALGIRLDPEYYQPRYLLDAERLAACAGVALHEIAFVTDGIHSSPDEVAEGGISYLSAKCIKNNDFSMGRAISISEKQHAANPRTQLRVDDVLVTTVGTIGNSAVVQADVIPANADRHLGIIRLKSDSGVSPYYLAAFLNSEYGKFQTAREATGNVQLNLFIEKIRQLRIPILKCAEVVAAEVKASYRERERAISLVAKAEQTIADVLGLSNMDMAPSLTYESTLADLRSSRRYGAEFHMPAKEEVLKALSSGPHVGMSACAENIREVWNPAKATGEIRNFDLGDAMEPFLDERVDTVEVSSVKSVKKRVINGDVLVSRLRSYLRQIAVVRSSEGALSVCSSEFIVLRPTGVLDAETLLAYLRSTPVQTVLTWSQDGTNHPRFDQSILMSLPVPRALIDRSSEVADIIRQAITSRQAMQTHLEHAESAITSEIVGASA